MTIQFSSLTRQAKAVVTLQIGSYTAKKVAVALAGGNANNGANCGVLCFNWNNTASNSNWNYAGALLLSCLIRECSILATPLGENGSKIGSRLVGIILERLYKMERIFSYA